MSDWSSDVCSSDLLLRVRAVVVQWVTDLASRVCRVLGTGCRNVFVRPGTYAGTGWVRFEVATAPRDLDQCRRQTITMSSAVRGDRQSVVSGMRAADRVDLDGRRIIKKKNKR